MSDVAGTAWALVWVSAVSTLFDSSSLFYEPAREQHPLHSAVQGALKPGVAVEAVWLVDDLRAAHECSRCGLHFLWSIVSMLYD